MRFLRKPFVIKCISITLLLIFFQSIVLTPELFALTGGPHQPEYTSYEETLPTDMVNLITGDFTYGIPAVTVPGPDGGFSMPLSYHSGIGLDQEASWVGLGWSLNPGAIIRNVVEYPDDAKGQTQEVHRENQDLEHGWTMNLPVIGQFGYSSNRGHSGRISLLGVAGFSYSGGQISGGNFVGVNFNSSKIEVDPVGVFDAALTIATLGTALAARAAKIAAGETVNISAAGLIAKEAAMELGFGLIMNAAFSGSLSSSPTSGVWEASHHESGFLKREYNFWLDQTRYEDMFGVLYLGDMPTNYTLPAGARPIVSANLNDGFRASIIPNTYVEALENNDNGAASDMHYYYEDKEYGLTFNPTSLSKDVYSVQGAGVSGRIEPYRIDMGSLAMPRKMSWEHLRFATAPFHSSDEYKVQFRYQNSLSNRYSFHSGSLTPDPESPILGFTSEIDKSDIDNIKLKIDINDNALYHHSTVSEPDRIGLINNKLSVGNNIEWFTNQEIIEGIPGFIDVYENDDPQRIDFRNYINIEHTNPQPESNIGAFQVTRADGMKYHYSLPILDTYNYTYIENINDPDDITEIKRHAPYATSWLLTAITGPDYLDRNNNGIPDEGDWGMWTKLNYGKYIKYYGWRIPYSGYRNSSDNKYKSYSGGIRQSYYLNSIQTRSHTALFLLDDREDALSSNESYPGMILFNEKSLRLNRAILLSNHNYSKLITPVAEGGFGFNTNTTGCSKGYCNIWYYPDLENNIEAKDFISQNALSQIVFNHDYSLCKSIPNATTPNSTIGKLTLKSISLLGKNEFKIMPDYEFEYASNPNYDINYWDGWGYYNPSGTTVGTSHQAYQGTSFIAPWTLSRITDPLGGVTEIEYERDDYSSVAGTVLKEASYVAGFYENSNPSFWNCLGEKKIFLNSAGFSVGDNVLIDYTTNIRSSDETACNFDPLVQSGQVETVITAKGANYIEVEPVLIDPNPCTSYVIYCDEQFLLGGTKGTVTKIDIPTINKKGGDYRVAVINVTDEKGNIGKTRYLYTEDGTTNGTSSGVVSREPEYIKTIDYPLYKFFDWPSTPVLYGRITTLNGKLEDVSDYHSKNVFEFEVPDQSMLLHEKISYRGNQPDASDFELIGQVDDWSAEGTPIAYVSLQHNKITIRTNQIGQMKKISVFNGSGELVSQSSFDYTEQLESNQGLFTEGSLLFEKVRFSGEYADNRLFRFIRTFKKYLPSTLNKITTTKDGLTSEVENKSWDFITGLVTRKTSKDPMGLKYESVTIPAYHKYEAMGPVTDSAGNAHMLSQTAANYVYKLNTDDSRASLLGASAQTWQNDWNNYRELNAGAYADSDLENHNVWRINESYVWKGDIAHLNEDGTYDIADFDEYDFTTTINPGWEKGGTANRFNHYSVPLESEDISGIKNAIKFDDLQQYPALKAGNAGYFEVAYTGAEKYNGSTGYFEAEVKKDDNGLATISSTYSHTGSNSLAITGGNKGFIYQADLSGLDYDRNFRVLAWVHETNAANAKLYADIDGTTYNASYNSAIKAGEWYMMELIVPVPGSASTMEVWCQSSGGTVYFDDFRVQPLDAGMNAYVYGENDELVYVLDNNNFFTRYEYDDAGKVVATYREIVGESVSEKLISRKEYNYAGEWGANQE